MSAARSICSLFSRLSIRSHVQSRSISCVASPSTAPTRSRNITSRQMVFPALLQPPLTPTAQALRFRYFPRVKGDRHDGLIYDPVLERYHAAGPPKPRPKKRHPIDNKPFMKGVVIKTLIKKPKKPNSANRKCVLVRLSNGKEATAYVPGVGHNLQEHSVVLVYRARTKDVPGLKLKVVRGKYDCAHVIRKPQAGS
ncbi:small ribosomal subunit protein uS12m-like [Ornithodoros turicata]|uniref:small ribosomal subunit protein uS12m-like n=1 Tax=Ornithodoros turicata TaxID=34597 RepID=UPI00313A42B5